MKIHENDSEFGACISSIQCYSSNRLTYSSTLRPFKALNCIVLAKELAKVLYDEPPFANLKSYRSVVMQFEMMTVTVGLYLGL